MQGIRNMSGHSIEEAIAETDKWKKISYASLPVIVVFGAYVAYDHVMHHAHWHQVKYPYIAKRDKPMPWALSGGSDCGLFEYGECWQEDKAKKALKAAGM